MICLNGKIETQKNVLREQYKRLRQDNLSFFAFTATPKWKTKALFDEIGEDGKPPFHYYTMRQAIEEGFILDVLANYATWGQYFKLLKISESDKELSKTKAKKAKGMCFINLNPLKSKIQTLKSKIKTCGRGRSSSRP